MKIVVIHQNFLRPDAEGGSRFNEMTRYWREAGHDVTVIASQVNYKTSERAAKYRGKWIAEERENGVRVLRTYMPESVHSSMVGRMWAFASFTLSSTTGLLKEIDDADVVVTTSPNLLVVVSGLLGKWLKRWPFVFEVRDLWPESAVATGVFSEGSPIIQGLYALEALGYHQASQIVVLTPAFRDDIVERGLADADKISFVPNGADLDMFTPGPPDEALRRKLGWEDKFVVLYSGAHGVANHLWQYIDTAERLRDRDDIVLASVGSGPEKQALVEETKKRGLTNMHWLDGVPKSEMPALVRAADASTAILKKVDTFKTVYPNKIFDAMASARPVLCAIDGVARQLVEDAEAGYYVEPENPDDFAAKIVKLAESPDDCEAMGRNGRAYVEEHFDRKKLAHKYLDILGELVD